MQLCFCPLGTGATANTATTQRVNKMAKQIAKTNGAKLVGKAAKGAVTKALTGKATARPIPPAVKVPATGTITLTVHGKQHVYRSATKAKQLQLAKANSSVAKYLAAGGAMGHLSRMARWGIITVK